MHILVSNDDGITAPGIVALARSLRQIARVTVVAPLAQQSAVGHAITISTLLRVTEHRDADGSLFGHAVSGTPADAVKFAVRTLLEGDRPDLLISGINHGSNTAANVIYSGTVSAATEGTLLGIPSAAMSLTTFAADADFSVAARFAQTVARELATNPLPAGTLLNVNVPALAADQIRGVKITRQGKSFWDDRFEQRLDPGQKPYYWLTGEHRGLDEADDTDEGAVNRGFISVTPIHYDLTDYSTLPALSGWSWEPA